MWQPPYFPSPKASSRASNGTGTWHAARHTTIQVHTPVHHSKRASSNATSAQLPLNKVTSPMQAIAWVTGDRYTGKEYISGAQKRKLWSEARTKEQGHLKVAERQKALKLGNCCGQVTHLCKGSTCDGNQHGWCTAVDTWKLWGLDARQRSRVGNEAVASKATGLARRHKTGRIKPING